MAVLRSPEETEALEWAKKQDFTSAVGAKIRLLAGYVERLEDSAQQTRQLDFEKAYDTPF